MGKKHSGYIIDTLLVFLNVSNPYTLIPCLLFTRNIGVNTLIIAFINIIYIFCRFGYQVKIPRHDSLFYLYVTIYVLNACFGFYTDTFVLGMLTFLFSNVSFYLILCNLYHLYYQENTFEQAVKKLTKGYVWLGIYALFSAFALLFLMEVFQVNPLVNEISHSYDILADNVGRNPNVHYYFPYHLSVIYSNMYELRLPFIHKYGIVTGLFHEPHTMTFIIVPLYFLLLYFCKKKSIRIWITVIFVLYILQAASTMSFLCFLGTVMVGLVATYRKMLLGVPFLIWGIFLLYSIDNPITELIKYKLTSGSADYSTNTLLFAFTPTTLIGTSFLNLAYLHDVGGRYDVGFIIFLLNIIFLSILAYKIFCVTISRAGRIKFIGLFGVYFFLHSTKLAMSAYTISLLMFVMFLITVTYRELKTSNYDRES